MLTNVESIRNNSIRTLQSSNHLILSTNIITTNYNNNNLHTL